MTPWLAGAAHDLAAIRHSASVPPWANGDIHLLDDAEEIYFAFHDQGLTLSVPPLDDKVAF